MAIITQGSKLAGKNILFDEDTTIDGKWKITKSIDFLGGFTFSDISITPKSSWGLFEIIGTSNVPFQLGFSSGEYLIFNSSVLYYLNKKVYNTSGIFSSYTGNTYLRRARDSSYAMNLLVTDGLNQISMIGGSINLNGHSLIFNYTDSGNIDHIWFNTSTQTFVFVADRSLQNTYASGNLEARSIILSGNLTTTNVNEHLSGIDDANELSIVFQGQGTYLTDVNSLFRIETHRTIEKLSEDYIIGFIDIVDGGTTYSKIQAHQLSRNKSFQIDLGLSTDVSPRSIVYLEENLVGLIILGKNSPYTIYIHYFSYDKENQILERVGGQVMTGMNGTASSDTLDFFRGKLNGYVYLVHKTSNSVAYTFLKKYLDHSYTITDVHTQLRDTSSVSIGKYGYLFKEDSEDMVLLHVLIGTTTSLTFSKILFSKNTETFSNYSEITISVPFNASFQSLYEFYKISQTKFILAYSETVGGYEIKKYRVYSFDGSSITFLNEYEGEFNGITGKLNVIMNYEKNTYLAQGEDIRNYGYYYYKSFFKPMRLAYFRFKHLIKTKTTTLVDNSVEENCLIGNYLFSQDDDNNLLITGG